MQRNHVCSGPFKQKQVYWLLQKGVTDFLFKLVHWSHYVQGGHNDSKQGTGQKMGGDDDWMDPGISGEILILSG